MTDSRSVQFSDCRSHLQVRFLFSTTAGIRGMTGDTCLRRHTRPVLLLNQHGGLTAPP